MAKAADLKRRWYEPGSGHLRTAVLSWLAGSSTRPEEIGLVDGRVDLRGIPLTASPAAFGDQDDPDAGVRWEALDFRFAQIDGLRLFGPSIVDCLFDSASMVDLRLWGATVSDCSFRRADMRSQGGLGGEWRGLRNIWRNVAFDGANLRESAFLGCSLESCSFARNGNRVLIQDCVIKNCRFMGDFESLIIDGNGHRFPVDPADFVADFSEAMLTDSHIIGYNLRNVLLPSQPDLIVANAFPVLGRRAIAFLKKHGRTHADAAARSILEMWCAASRADSSDLCFDLRGLDPEAAQAVRGALAAAQRPSGVADM